MSVIQIDLTPSPHSIESQRNQGMTWWKALAELIDNAFDAKANRVEIIVKGRVVTVKDNGKGMRDIRDCLRQGSHIAANGRGLGMYGVGLKDAWLYAGDIMDVVTVRDGIKTRLQVDLSQVSALQSWNIQAESHDEPTSDPTGTAITLHLRKGRSVPSKGVLDKLAWVFSPGLRRGLQIVCGAGVSQQPLAAVPLPKLTDSVECDFDINGKAVSLHVGILADGEKMPEGPFCFGYKHRVIESSSLGAKGLSTFNVAGNITLGDGWVFTKNKDAIAESYEELESEIFSRIEPLLRKAELQSMDVETSALLQELDSVVAVALKNARREKRDSSGDSEGTVTPKATGRKRRSAAKTTDNPGSVTDSTPQQRRGAKIDFYNGNDEIGRYDVRGHRIGLNIGHSFINRLRKDKHTLGLAGAAMAILADHATTHDGDQKLMSVAAETFIKAFSALTETLNGQ